MELLIVMCLLMVILLLISDKVEIRKIVYKKDEPSDTDDKSPDIMGKSRYDPSHLNPKTDKASQLENQQEDSNNFTQESEKRNQVLQEEPEEKVIDFPDFEEEEEEFRKLSFDEWDNGLAHGVTFEELSTVANLLREENSDHFQREAAATIVQKIHGTELFILLENSMETASEKIAKLLESRFPIDTTSGSSTMQNKNIQDFDIGEFV